MGDLVRKNGRQAPAGGEKVKDKQDLQTKKLCIIQVRHILRISGEIGLFGKGFKPKKGANRGNRVPDQNKLPPKSHISYYFYSL